MNKTRTAHYEDHECLEMGYYYQNLMKENSLTWLDRHFCHQPLFVAIVLIFVALAVRLSALGRYITPDELIWVYRSILFREALLARSWADTLVAGHPGVITTWLGTLGITGQIFFNGSSVDTYKWLTHLAWLTPDNMVALQKLSEFLSVGRILVAAVNSLGIVTVYWLARRLFKACLALLFALLLAIDPFFAGLGGLLHVDGLVTTFVIISLLSLALAAGLGLNQETTRSRYLYAALSGATAALAVLSKSPALLLLPVTAFVFLFMLWQSHDVQFKTRLRSVVFLGIVWSVLFFLSTILLYPALWISPLHVLQFAGGNAGRHVAEALRPTYFLGRVAFDHGPIFYPVAIAWRIGPVVAVGLVILAALVLDREHRRRMPWRTIVIFLLWTVLFVGLLTVTAKKFDRYALPVFPALTVLSVIGWGSWLRPGNRLGWSLLAGLIALQVLYTLFVFPYPLSAYNPLLGGPFTAQKVLSIGWGESISEAGSWLAAEGNMKEKAAVSSIAPSLAPFFPGTTLLAENNAYEQSDFVIITAGNRQGDLEGVEDLTNSLDLLHKIRYGGLDQAWIYSNPGAIRQEPSVENLAWPITFDGKMNLLGHELRVSDGEIDLTARWEKTVPNGRYFVKLRIVDEFGFEWAEIETSLLNAVYFYPQYWESGETPVVAYELDLASTAPPGKYHILLALGDESTRALLPAYNQDQFVGVEYDVGDITWIQPRTDQSIQDVEVIDTSVSLFENALQLVGYKVAPSSIVSGADLTLDLYWRADKPLQQDVEIGLQLGNEAPVSMPLSRIPSSDWQTGTIIQEKYRLPVPVHMQTGETAVQISVSSPDYPQREESVSLGNVEVLTTDRLFSLPDQIPVPLEIEFDPGVFLRGASALEVSTTPGGSLPLTLYWQAAGKTQSPVTAFLHLIDAGGNIVSQIDRWPAGLPSNIWAEGQVIIDEYELAIPADLQPGLYQFAVGLYDANDGQRYEALNRDGTRIADDRFILPLSVEIEP